METLDRISLWIAKISEAIAALLMGSVAIVLFTQVFMRFVLHKGIIWADQYTRYFTIWAVMLAANALVRDDELIKVDFFDSMWPKAMIKVRERIYQVFFFVLLIVLLYFGTTQALEGRGVRLLGLPFDWFVPYMAIPVGSALMLFQYIVQFIKTFRKEDDAS